MLHAGAANHAGSSRLAAALGIVLAALDGVHPCRANPVFSSFESGLEGWSAQASISVPDPLPWDWSVTRSQQHSSDGAWSLQFTASGVNDDGTVWVERPLQLPAGEWEIRLDFDLWSPTDAEIGTWQKVAFIGSFDPEAEEEFTVLGLPDVGGWKTYSLAKTIVLSTPGPVWCAFGLNIVFETTRTHYCDAATILWSPLDPVQGGTWSQIKALFR